MHHHILQTGDSTLETLGENYRKYFEDALAEDTDSDDDEVNHHQATLGLPPTITADVQVDNSRSNISGVLLMVCGLTVVLASMAAVVYAVPSMVISETSTSLVRPIVPSSRLATNDGYIHFSQASNISNELILLEHSGSSAFHLSKILTKCLDFMEIDNNKAEKPVSELDKPTFFRTNSLCNIAKKMNKKSKIFVLVHNPVVRVMNTFYEKKDRFSDLQVEKMNFDSLLQSAIVDENPLTRSITCKENGKVGTKDFEEVEKIMNEHGIISVLSNLKELLTQVPKEIGLKSETSREQENCINNEYVDLIRNIPPLNKVSEWAFEKILSNNNWDFELYSFASTLHNHTMH